MKDEYSTSEKYRKYIIRVQCVESRNYYICWGTDIAQENGDDFLLLNTQNKILGFSSIDYLVTYIRDERENLIDNDNFKKWSFEYNEKQAYTTYNIEAISQAMKEGLTLDSIDFDLANEIINFFYLFTDFALQTKLKNLLALIEDENNCYFIDWILAKYMYEDMGSISVLEKRLNPQKLINVQSNFETMIQNFTREFLYLISSDPIGTHF